MKDRRTIMEIQMDISSTIDPVRLAVLEIELEEARKYFWKIEGKMRGTPNLFKKSKK